MSRPAQLVTDLCVLLVAILWILAVVIFVLLFIVPGHLFRAVGIVLLNAGYWLKTRVELLGRWVDLNLP